MDQPTSSASRFDEPVSRRRVRLATFLLLAAIGGYASAQDAPQNQASPPPASTPPPPRPEYKRTPEANATPPAVTDSHQATDPHQATDSHEATDPHQATDPHPATDSHPATDPREAQITADTQKLLKLSQELKAEVAKSNKDTLSLSVIKKAEEVEKLAKTLRDELSKTQ